MLKMALLTSLVFSATAFATVEKIESTKENGLLARVEKVVTLQKGNTAVRLVQIDNGGSTDATSFYSPSSLHLTIFQQREDFDTEASFEVFNSMKSFKVLHFDLKAGTVDISVEQLLEDSEDDKFGTYYYRLFIKDAVQATYNGGFKGDLKGATVGVQDITPRP